MNETKVSDKETRKIVGAKKSSPSPQPKLISKPTEEKGSPKNTQGSNEKVAPKKKMPEPVPFEVKNLKMIVVENMPMWEFTTILNTHLKNVALMYEFLFTPDTNFFDEREKKFINQRTEYEKQPDLYDQEKRIARVNNDIAKNKEDREEFLKHHKPFKFQGSVISFNNKTETFVFRVTEETALKIIPNSSQISNYKLELTPTA